MSPASALRKTPICGSFRISLANRAESRQNPAYGTCIEVTALPAGFCGRNTREGPWSETQTACSFEGQGGWPPSYLPWLFRSGMARNRDSGPTLKEVSIAFRCRRRRGDACQSHSWRPAQAPAASRLADAHVNSPVIGDMIQPVLLLPSRIRGKGHDSHPPAADRDFRTMAETLASHLLRQVSKRDARIACKCRSSVTSTLA